MQKNVFPAFSIRKAAGAEASVVICIDCLDVGELQTGISFYQGFLDTVHQQDPSLIGELGKTVQRIQVDSLACICNILESLGEQIFLKNLSVFLLIDGHGDKEEGLRTPSGEFFSWDLMLVCFSKLTEQARGNLTIVGAFCYSAKIIEKINIANKNNIFKKSPVVFFYGYESFVSAGQIKEDVRRLYKSLVLDGGEKFSEVLETGKTGMSLYSEYDFILPFLVITIAALRPEYAGVDKPLISKKEIIQEIGKSLAQSGLPQSGISRSIRKILRTDGPLKAILKQHMHETERLEYLLADVKTFFENLDKP